MLIELSQDEVTTLADMLRTYREHVENGTIDTLLSPATEVVITKNLIGKLDHAALWGDKR